MEAQKVNDNMYYLILLGSFGGILLASAVIFFYLRYQKRIVIQRAEMQQAELAHRQHLLYATIQSQENERLRISKDLHDHIGSALSNLRFLASRIKQHTHSMVAASAIVDEYKSGIDELIEEVRGISHSLSPAGLSLWGLRETLDAYCEKICQSADIAISITDTSANILEQVPYDISLSLFRVMQELIANTLKHAQARNILITISGERNIIITYHDDGIGTDIRHSHKGIGLYNIESRLGMVKASYKIDSSPGNGYKCTICIAPQ